MFNDRNTLEIPESMITALRFEATDRRLPAEQRIRIAESRETLNMPQGYDEPYVELDFSDLRGIYTRAIDKELDRLTKL